MHVVKNTKSLQGKLLLLFENLHTSHSLGFVINHPPPFSVFSGKILKFLYSSLKIDYDFGIFWRVRIIELYYTDQKNNFKAYLFTQVGMNLFSWGGISKTNPGVENFLFILTWQRRKKSPTMKLIFGRFGPLQGIKRGYFVQIHFWWKCWENKIKSLLLEGIYPLLLSLIASFCFIKTFWYMPIITNTRVS